MVASLPAGSSSADGQDVREDLLDIAAGLTAKVTELVLLRGSPVIVQDESAQHERKLHARACDESSLHVSPNNSVDTHRNEITTVLRLWRPLRWAHTMHYLCSTARQLVLHDDEVVPCACRLRRAS